MEQEFETKPGSNCFYKLRKIWSEIAKVGNKEALSETRNAKKNVDCSTRTYLRQLYIYRNYYESNSLLKTFTCFLAIVIMSDTDAYI